jgi:uncharacterized protein YaiE (UPF0345 family)
MIHYSKWLARTRSARRMQLTAPIGLLLACLLLAGLPAAASASTPEMRGEWELVIKAPGETTVKGIAVISVEANGSGEFATSNLVLERVVHGTFSGTLEGAKASVEVTSEADGSLPAGKFTSHTMTVEPSGPLPSIYGGGELTSGTTPVPGATVVATRIKTYKEVEEREAKEEKEKQELEEQKARENIRGEWSLLVKVGPQTSNGTALIKVAANAENEFASSNAMFESVVPGSFSGTLEGSTATVTVTSEAYGPVPAGEFVGEKIAVNSTGDSMSISGTGKFYSNKALITESATLVATRTKTNAEVVAREAKEKLELEAKEQEAKAKAEQETKAKAEQEAKAKAELEAKAEQEAKAKAELEAKAKAEQEAKAKAEQEAQKKATVSKVALVSIQLAGKTFTVSAAGLLSLQVSNPNAYAISGRITLEVAQSAKAGKASSAHGSASKKAVSLGTVSFGISPSGKQIVKLELSQTGRTELARHKTLRVLATVLTKASGQTTTTKALTLTLRAGKAAQGKH